MDAVIRIPALPQGITVPAAALLYAAAGWFVGPASVQTKHPGSLLGKGWDTQTSTDPAQIGQWWQQWPEAGLFLHLGRSGVTGIDIDHPEKLPGAHPDFARAVFSYAGPVQTTRVGDYPVPDPLFGTGATVRKSHILFLTPADRRISNSNGDTNGHGKRWGEVRGENGVIMVAPSEHTKVDGLYQWQRDGAVPPMPLELSVLLREAGPKVDAATHGQLVAARGRLRGAGDVSAFQRGPLAEYERRVAGGDHRHEVLNSVMPWVHRDALAGLYPLDDAENEIRARHIAACSNPDLGSGAIRDADEAGREFDAQSAWSHAQALRADPAVTLARATSALAGPPDSVYQIDDLFGDVDKPAGPISGLVPAGPRRLTLTAATTIPMRAQRWLWWDRELRAKWVPLGGIVLLGGREGLGKSTLATKVAAAVTRGALPGNFYGVARSVIVAAGEDAWEQTILPRFVAAGADLSRVFRVDVQSSDGQAQTLELPVDNQARLQACLAHDVALIILDPLMTIVGGKLDTHKDADVRKALGPLRDMAEAAQVTVLGLIHVSKSKDEDLLTRMMASRAFTAVARAVLFCARQAPETNDDGEPEDDGPETFLFGQLKNNLGVKVRHTVQYQIETVVVGHDAEIGEDIETSRIVDIGTRDERINEIVTGQESGRKKPAPKRDAAGEWLISFLTANGPQTPARVEVAATGLHSRSAVHRARNDRGVLTHTAHGEVLWSAPPAYVTPGT